MARPKKIEQEDIDYKEFKIHFEPHRVFISDRGLYAIEFATGDCDIETTIKSAKEYIDGRTI
jgi:hypothetical protein